MAGRSRVKIVFNDLPKISTEMRARAGQITASTARNVASGAKAAVPVDSGTLQASIEAVHVGKFRWQIITGTDYAHFVEYGTGHGPAQPYLNPAAHHEEPAFLSKLRNLIPGS